MEIPDDLTCLLRNPCVGQEATVRSGQGTTDWFKSGKGVCQGCILSTCLFNFPGGSDGKTTASNAGGLGSIPGLGRFHGEGNGNPLQYSCLENPMDGGGWCRVLSVGLQRVGHDWATSLHCWYNFLKNVVDFLWMAQQYSPLQRSYIHNIFWDNPFSIFGSCWDDWGPNRFLEDL